MVELIFTHIPKTAGLSFLHTLNEVYGQKNVRQVWDYLEEPRNDMALTDIGSPFWSDYAGFRTRLEEQLKGVKDKVLHGHLPVWFLEDMFPGVPRVTWMREPIEQVLSRVFHYRKESFPIAQEYTPQGLARRPWFRNSQFFYTGGSLRNFAFVGVVERYEEDLKRLAGYLDWPDVEPLHLHRTEYEDDTRLALRSDVDFCEEMRQLNYRDVALYEWAKMRRERALGTV